MKEKLLNLFSELSDREDSIKSIRQEMKDAIEIFCEEHDECEIKSVKEAYRVYKKFTKDRTEAVNQEFQRDKLVDILMNL